MTKKKPVPQTQRFALDEALRDLKAPPGVATIARVFMDELQRVNQLRRREARAAEAQAHAFQEAVDLLKAKILR